jgi:hypothetical protein
MLLSLFSGQVFFPWKWCSSSWYKAEYLTVCLTFPGLQSMRSWNDLCAASSSIETHCHLASPPPLLFWTEWMNENRESEVCGAFKKHGWKLYFLCLLGSQTLWGLGSCFRDELQRVPLLGTLWIMNTALPRCSLGRVFWRVWCHECMVTLHGTFFSSYALSLKFC